MFCCCLLSWPFILGRDMISHISYLLRCGIGRQTLVTLVVRGESQYHPLSVALLFEVALRLGAAELRRVQNKSCGRIIVARGLHRERELVSMQY